MRATGLVSSVIGCAVLCGWGLSAHARPDRQVRTGPDDSYAIFGNGEKEAAAWVARGHAAPVAVPVPPSSWILDAVLDDAQRLWAALGQPREGPVRIGRFEGQKQSSVIVEGTSAVSEARLFLAGGSVYLATPVGLWRVDGPSAQRLATWSTDSYGFYAASLARSGSRWLLLVPTFNTCGSSDLLERLDLFESAPSGPVEQRTVPLPPGPLGQAWLGADGWRYGLGCDGGVGLIGRHRTGPGWPLLHREPAPDCRYSLEQNGLFTIALFGKALVRVHEGRVERLGVADRVADPVEAYYPDRRGRALVLHKDGTVVRYSSRQPPEVLGRVAAPAP